MKQKGLAAFMHTERGFAPIIFILGILIASGLIIGGSFYLKNSQTPKPAVISQTPTASPKPTSADETADWKTYTSKFNYTFKYPPNLQIKVSASSDIPTSKEIINIVSTDRSQGNAFYGFNDWITVWDNLGIQINDLATRNKWCDKLELQIADTQLECNHGGNLSLIDINSYKAYQYQGGMSASTVRGMYIPHGNYVYEISLDEGLTEKLEYQKLNDQILSTFKFLDKESLSRVYWEVPENTLSPALEKEIKATFNSYNPSNTLQLGQHLVVMGIRISPKSGNFIFAGMAIKDENDKFLPIDGFEYLLYKVQKTWKIVAPGDENFCEIFKRAPEDLTEPLEDYYSCNL